MTEPFFLGATGAGDPMMLDLERLIGSHAGIVANSGGGKSGLIRRLLEATHGRVQHIVLDPEDEFYTLRERYEYVIAGGDGGDAPATIANAPDLALGALTHGFSLVVQLNDLGVDRGAEFIGAFLTALVNAPRNLWHPVLVTIDEAQRFVPRLGSTEATEGVKELIYRGRKRGFTALLAGTKFTEIDPAVRGGINNWMLGRVGQAVDRNTMAEQLGFTAKEGRDRLRGMEPRHFWAFGPALRRRPGTAPARGSCHWPGCNRQVPPARWGCREHWFRLPPDLRSRIWRAYRIGQEEDGRPSAAYLAVAREAQEWIKAHLARGPRVDRRQQELDL